MSVMTSNGDPVLNASSLPAASIDGRPHNTPSPRQTTSKAASPSSKENRPLPPNGDHEHDDAQGDSEAETVVIGSRGDDSPQKKVIKTERNDDDDDARLRAIKEGSRAHTPLSNGQRRPSNGKEIKINGAKHGAEREGKSPPTSPSSRTTSRHTKDTSPTDSNKSPVRSTLSPTQNHVRGRSVSTAENRKRKLRDESFPKSIEPPRQKARTEGLKESRQPVSPATPGFGRPHKRSQSTQSTVNGVAGRKRRETTNLAMSIERAPWAEDNSDDSDSDSGAAHTPNVLQHTRVKRSSHRALTSPARTMPKSKTDKFGATRLARESEKGDLDAVKEAFEEAPDELNQADYAGIAPLQKASLHGWEEVVRYLISKGCNTACESNDRDTPLIDAVENGHLDVVRLLLNEGHVNPHHANKKGQRAIDVMNYEDDDAEEIEKVLREAMRRETNTSRVDKPPERKQAKTVSRLLYNEYNVETLIEKAGGGDILAVGELINSNIKPNITCGVAAARGGHYDILSILLASGLKADPDPSKHPETPMTVAIGRGHLKIVELLLEQDNFDPTRRNKENKTYYELAEERAGPRWEVERDVLKRAYDERKGQHRSPRRPKKEAPNLSAIRTKRSSLPKRDRSSSPRPDAKRAHLTKSSTVPNPPQKSRRLMSGKEMASREGQRRKRVVDDESSEESSEEDVRPPHREIKPRAFSLGEEDKPIQRPVKAQSDDNDTTKRKVRARSDESEDDHGSAPKPPTKIRKPLEKPSSARPTSEIDSPDERKVIKNKIKYKTMEDKIRKRKMSDASTDDRSIKKTPNVSAKSTPAPPERTATPEAVRERRQEEQRLETEARKNAAEAAAQAERQRKEDEEIVRKAAEDAEARRAEEEAEAEREAQRQAEEAEATRKREEEESKRRADEETKRQELLAARQDRISKLPIALRRACELGHDRPLHFSGEQLGISVVFLPLLFATSRDLKEPDESHEKTYICSFQLVGILGLPELDLAHLEAPYVDWPRTPVTSEQRNAILRQYDVALLAQDFRFPMEGTPDFDYCKIVDSIKKAKSQFLAMDGLYWIEESLLHSEAKKVDSLQKLLNDISRRRVRLTNIDNNTRSEPTPRRTFMDLVSKQNDTNGVHVNGDAG
jgi:ankyrin repeat protein